MNLRPRDLAVVLKLALDRDMPTYHVLAQSLAISVSEAHGAVRRAIAAGLLGPQRQVNRPALLAFLAHGIRFVFFAKRGRLTRGMPTAHGAPPLDKLVARSSEPVPVWPDPDGDTVGETFAPLYANAPKAARKDPRLYELMCLVDAVRGGRPRDRALAEQRLRAILAPTRAATSQPDALSAPPFSPDTARRRRLVKQLGDLGPGPAAFYRDALKLLETPLESSSHLVGHLAREIMSALQDVLAVGEGPTHPDQIRAILAALDLPVDGTVATKWLSMVGRDNEAALHRRAHRDNLEAPRAAGPAFLTFWEDFEEVLDVVLDAMEKRYVRVFERLDALLGKLSPTRKDAEELRQAIPQSSVALGYFLRKLESPDWIALLRSEGYFERPPASLPQKRGVTFPRWPALEYLVRMAPARPDQVAKIVLAMPDSDNVVVHETTVDVVLALPGDLAAPFAARIVAWLGPDTSHALVEKSAALITKLIADGLPEEAVRLLRALIKPQSGDGGPRGLVVEWNMESMLHDLEPALARLGEPALRALCDALDEAIALEPPVPAIEPWDSSIWQPTIDGDGRPRDIRSLLLMAARDCAVNIMSAAPEQIGSIVSELEARRWTVFRRLAGHLARRFAEHAPELAAERPTDPYASEIMHVIVPTPAIDPVALAGMSVEKIVEAVSSSEPSGAFGADPQGLSRQIAAIVSSKPGVFASQAHLLAPLRATFLRAVLDGFTTAIVESRDFAWEPVVELCVWATTHERQTRKAVVRLLAKGMSQEKVAIPMELAPSIWAALVPALDDPDATGEDDRRRRLRDDAYQVAINTVRGSALEAVVDFAWWTAQGALGGGLSRNVREALEAKLADPAAAVRAVFGARFHVLAALDEPWCAERSPDIFPREGRGREPAWQAFVRYASRTAEAYRVLRWRYREAVVDLGDDDDARRIAADLARLYWHGWIDLGDRDGDLDLFYDHATPGVAGELLEALGRGLSEANTPSAETLERLKRLWSRRLLVGRPEELAAFGWWFSSGRFDGAWSLRELETVLRARVIPAVPDRVAKRLAALAPDHAAEAVACTALLWQASEQSWESRYVLARAPAILDAAMVSGDVRARRGARELANRLLKAGQEAFRPFA